MISDKVVSLGDAKMDDDKSVQEGELDALKSIYYQEEFQIISLPQGNENAQAIFFAFLQLPDDYIVKYKPTLESTEYSYLKVKHLPPIELQITLPQNYPSQNPPEFVIRCQWLEKRQIVSLCQKLDDIWNENPNVEVIYTFCEFLKNDTLSFLGNDKCLDISKLNEVHLYHMKGRRSVAGRFECGNSSKAEKENAEQVKPNSNGESYFSHGNIDLKKFNRGTRERKQVFKDLPRRGQRKKFPGGKNEVGEKRIHDKRAVIPLTLSTSPIKLLEDYNKERVMVEFLKNCYTCSICYMDKLGKDCIKFNMCNHVFCKACIQDYFTVKINDGSVQTIKCPEPKCLSEALPSQVKEMVSEELFAKYDKLLLNTALDTFNDIIYCPRSFCQYPVIKEPDEQLAHCFQCQYVFCVYCKTVYHGVEPCKFKSEEKQKLIAKYKEASPEIKMQMELRYGKKQLQTFVNNSMAEDWIKTNSKPCPSCCAAIEKSQGCNKMVCWKCNTYFCWLCEAELDPNNPYFHYSDPYSRCNTKLFHLVDPEEPEEWAQEEEWQWVEESDDEDFLDIEFQENAAYFL